MVVEASKSKTDQKKYKKVTLDRAWIFVTAGLFVVALVLLIVASSLNEGDGDNTYRKYAATANQLAVFGILTSFLGLFVVTTRKAKVILGSIILPFLLLAFCSHFVATFYIVW